MYIFQHIQVNRPLFNMLKNAGKRVIGCDPYKVCTGYKLYMGRIHTLVLAKEWIARLHVRQKCTFLVSMVTVIQNCESFRYAKSNVLLNGS